MAVSTSLVHFRGVLVTRALLFCGPLIFWKLRYYGSIFLVQLEHHVPPMDLSMILVVRDDAFWRPGFVSVDRGWRSNSKPIHVCQLKVSLFLEASAIEIHLSLPTQYIQVPRSIHDRDCSIAAHVIMLGSLEASAIEIYRCPLNNVGFLEASMIEIVPSRST